MHFALLLITTVESADSVISMAYWDKEAKRVPSLLI